MLVMTCVFVRDGSSVHRGAETTEDVCARTEETLQRDEGLDEETSQKNNGDDQRAHGQIQRVPARLPAQTRRPPEICQKRR